MSDAAADRAPFRRRYIGVVTSDKMDKTITVSVDRLVMHPKFKKYVRSSTTIKAHDAEEAAKVGDRVEVMESRPLSKSKRFRLVRVVARSSGAGALPEGTES
jgi:small subunit ribosomal protein S17